MKKKSLLTMLLALCICIPLSACNSNETSDSSTSEENSTVVREYATGDYVLTDFEKASDLYAVKPYIPNLSTNIQKNYGQIEIVFDEQYKSGIGSLKCVYDEETLVPELAFYTEKTAYADMSLKNLQSFSIDVYNASETIKNATLSLAATSAKIYSENFELQAGWNTLTLTLDPIFVQYRIDDVESFSVQLESGGGTYYFDNWTVTLGQENLNEEQKAVISFVDAIMGLQGNVSSNVGETLINAYNLYSDFNELHRVAAAEYYSLFQEAVKEYVELLGKIDGDNEKKKLLFFGEKHGLLQLGLNENLSFSYDGNAMGEQQGSVKVEMDGTKEQYLMGFLIPTLVIDNYDYIAFNAYNPTEKYLSVSLNNSSETMLLAPHATTKVELPIVDLMESGNHFKLSVVDYNGEKIIGNLKENGTVYISEVQACMLEDQGVYSFALDSEASFNVSGTTLNKEGEKYTSTGLTGTVQMFPVKVVDNINISQSVTFEIWSKEFTEFSFYDKNDKLLKTVGVASGSNIITLDSKTYNSLKYISFAADANELKWTCFYLSRTVDLDYVSILLQNEYVLDSENITVENFREAFYYLCAFEDLTIYKQTYMKLNDSAIYNQIIDRAEKISAIMKTAISNFQANSATQTECKMLLELSDSYRQLKTVEKLTNTQINIVNNAKVALADREYTVFDFVNPLSKNLFIADNYWYDWSGNVYLSEFDNHAVLGINVARPSWQTYLYVQYDYSSIDATLKNYDYVTFRIFNPNEKEATVHFIAYGWQFLVKRFALPAEQWTEMQLSVSDFKRAGYFVISGCEEGSQFYLDNVTACSWQYVQNLIDALPDVENLTQDDRAIVAEARKKYETLSVGARMNVSEEKLILCEETLQKMPYTIFDMSKETSITDFTAHPDTTGFERYSWTGDIELVDSAYGKALQVNVSETSAGIVYIGYNVEAIDLTGYDYVSFKVYNSKPAAIRIAFISKGWGLCGYQRNDLTASGWTDIYVPVSAFEMGYLYFDYLSGDVTLQFTDFVAYGATTVQAMIDELPNPDEIEQSDRAQVSMVRTAYDALTSTSQGIINAEKLELCEKVLQEMPYTALDMGAEDILSSFISHPDTTGFSKYNWTGDIAVAETEYGKALQICVNSTQNNIVYIAYSLDGAELNGYDYVSFKLYNSQATPIRIAFISNGWGTCGYQRSDIAANAWTQIYVPVSAMKLGYIYFDVIPAETVLLLTDFVAYNAMTVQAMVNSLPDPTLVTATHQAQVIEVRNAYEALSAGAKEQVDITKLTLCEEILAQ